MPRGRPDPDQLLAAVEAREARATRGRLKIFFGASAGVGKTYAMLIAAQTQGRAAGDVVVGVLETHGRAETAALLEGLEALPPLLLDVQSASVKEFNLDAALARHPALILVDELAHTNAPGARHPKRWQDIDELLDSGIDVFTTLNVQHLESLNDVVGGITGIRVWETVPDTFFDEADDVILVDVPADELLARLKAGKASTCRRRSSGASRGISSARATSWLMVARACAAPHRRSRRGRRSGLSHRPVQTAHLENRGVAALLRRTGSEGGEHVVRSAARPLASQLAVEWTAAYVETPKLQRLPTRERERILTTLKLAQDLGAKTAVLSGNDAAVAIVEYAHAHNCSKLVIGSERMPSAWLARRGIARRAGPLAPDVDVIEIGRGELPSGTTREALVPEDAENSQRSAKRLRYAWALLACLATTLIATPLRSYFDLANIVMLFLLTVVLVAVRFGRGPAILAALVSVASFDFFFVPPRFSFAVSDVQYLLTLVVMLTVALITGQMTAGLRYQARVASGRARSALRRSTNSRATCRACCRPTKSSRRRASSLRQRSPPRSRS